MKAQMFVVAAIFLATMLFAIQQAFITYSQLDMSEPFDTKQSYVTRSIIKSVNDSILSTTRGCTEYQKELENLLYQLKFDVSREGYLMESDLLMNCEYWDNSYPAPPPLKISLRLSETYDYSGIIEFYHTEYICIPDCSCRPSTCVGDTCSDGCTGTCPGTMAPDCTGRECGPSGNVCGTPTQCGTCPGANDMCMEGMCVCVPPEHEFAIINKIVTLPDPLIPASEHGFYRWEPSDTYVVETPYPDDWFTPDNYWDGQIYFRYEVIEKPPLYWPHMSDLIFWDQSIFTSWDPLSSNATVMQTSPVMYGPESVAEFNQSLSNISVYHQNDGIDFHDVNNIGLLGFDIRYEQGRVTDWPSENYSYYWDNKHWWYPMKLKVTIVAVPDGETFSGWDCWIEDYEPPKTWYHVVGMYDGNEQSLYLDGVKIANISRPGSITDITEPIWVGDQPGSWTNRSWPGVLDDVRVYNRTLTEAQIKDLYNHIEPAGMSQYLELHYTFDDYEGGPSVTDSSPNGIDGTAMYGPVSIAGVNGTMGMLFDGVEEYVDTNRDFDIPSNELVISAWFQIDYVPLDEDPRILIKGPDLGDQPWGLLVTRHNEVDEFGCPEFRIGIDGQTYGEDRRLHPPYECELVTRN